MGLDDFKSDNTNDDEEDVEQSDEQDESQDEGVKLKEEDKATGLDSFRTETTEDDTGDELDRERSNPWMDDFTSGQWNDMSTKEKVKYVRENYYNGYRPEVDLDNDWEYRKVIEIKCECNNTFTFRSGGTCINCGRAYSVEDGVVAKKHDPHDNNNQEGMNNE